MPAGTCICRRCENERLALGIGAVWALDKLLTIAAVDALARRSRELLEEARAIEAALTACPCGAFISGGPHDISCPKWAPF